MRNWRVLTAVLAVVLAVIAGVLAWQYLSDADERASEDFELVPTIRAAADIPEGTTGAEAQNQELLETFDVPANAVPQKAITSPEEVSGLIAAATISEGQFITTDSFVTPLELRGFAQTIDEGMQAISVSVDQTRGVGGFIVPNDLVNILVTTDISPLVTPQDPATGEPIEGADEALTTTAYLLNGIKVLAVGATTATNVEEEAGDPSTGIITLEVNSEQAEQIAHAESQGTLVLSLNPPGFDREAFQVPVEIVEAVNWFDQELNCVNDLRLALGGTPEGLVAPTLSCARAGQQVQG